MEQLKNQTSVSENWSNDSDMISCYGNMVYRLAYARLQNRHDADDIFQEVFLRYVRRAPVFESYEHGKAWFLRTTINCCKNLWMSAWHRKTTTLTEAEEQPVCYENEDTQMLAEALASLPVKYRTVLHLYYYEGLTAEEISRIQQIPAGTVRMQLSRGRTMLKDALLKEQGEGGRADAGLSETVSRAESEH
ncbi:MAG: sigma-70 family RNA polymerase sigma factor [Peptococcaceae bacterium]|nr:sigma-70 family RNA polymerase sigma factor [Peptococcaceae bacterium]